MHLLPKAESMSRAWHLGQTYGTLPFFEGHIVPVVTLLETLGADSQQLAIGYLHDVVEDTFTPLSEIREHFGSRIADGVDAMTIRDEETYLEYMSRLIMNPDARLVKFCDSLCNLWATVNSTGLDEPKTSVRRIRKYSNNIAMLQRYL